MFAHVGMLAEQMGLDSGKVSQFQSERRDGHRTCVFFYKKFGGEMTFVFSLNGGKTIVDGAGVSLGFENDLSIVQIFVFLGR